VPPPAPSAGSLLLVKVLLYDRAKLLVGEPLLGVNLVGVLAGYSEELFVGFGLQVVALQRTLHRSHLYITPFPTFPTKVFAPILAEDAWIALLPRMRLPKGYSKEGGMGETEGRGKSPGEEKGPSPIHIEGDEPTAEAPTAELEVLSDEVVESGDPRAGGEAGGEIP
jgi:hypothetical protein